MDQALLDKVRALRKVHEGYGQHTPIIRLVGAARHALRDEAQRARFDALGGVIEHTDYGAKWYGPDYEGDEDALLRVLIVPDDDAGHCLDFDCCPDPDTGKPDTGARWQKCECVIYSDYREDVRSASDNEDRCRFHQPCKHKCDEARRIETYGAYGIAAQWRDASGAWVRGDECWGYVDDDWKEVLAEYIGAALEGYDETENAIAAEAMALTGLEH